MTRRDVLTTWQTQILWFTYYSLYSSRFLANKSPHSSFWKLNCAAKSRDSHICRSGIFAQKKAKSGEEEVRPVPHSHTVWLIISGKCAAWCCCKMESQMCWKWHISLQSVSSAFFLACTNMSFTFSPPPLWLHALFSSSFSSCLSLCVRVCSSMDIRLPPWTAYVSKP